MAGRDWTTMKAEYASTNISYRKLAEKHGVSFNTLKDRAKKDKWAEARKKYREKVVNKTLHKAASKAATTCAKQLARVATSAETATAMIERMMKDADQFRRHLITVKEGEGFGPGEYKETQEVEERLYDKYDTKALKEFTGALKDLVSVIRDVNDLPTLKERESYDIAVRRLVLDERKVDNDSTDDIEGVDVSFEDEEIGEMSE